MALKDITITLKIDPRVHYSLRCWAAENGVFLTNFFREAIAEKMIRHDIPARHSPKSFEEKEY